MKSLYIKEQHCFQEQPQQERPYNYGLIKEMVDNNFIVGVSEGSLADCKYYTDHLASLRTIPCRPSDNWQEGVLYIQGKDYAVCEYSGKNGYHSIEIRGLDKPVAPQSEGELWKEIFSERWSYIGNDNMAFHEFVGRLKSRYSITRKSDVPEAVEFGDFLRSYAPFDYRGDTLWRTRDGKKIHTTQELYEGDFLQHKIKKP